MTETTINVGHQNGHAGQNLSWIQFNLEYFKTRDGMLKILQLVSFTRPKKLSISLHLRNSRFAIEKGRNIPQYQGRC
jgi:hypothetical protein